MTLSEIVFTRWAGKCRQTFLVHWPWTLTFVVCTQDHRVYQNLVTLGSIIVFTYDTERHGVSYKQRRPVCHTRFHHSMGVYKQVGQRKGPSIQKVVHISSRMTFNRKRKRKLRKFIFIIHILHNQAIFYNCTWCYVNGLLSSGTCRQVYREDPGTKCREIIKQASIVGSK